MAHSHRDERQMAQMLTLTQGVELPSPTASGRDAIGALRRRWVEFVRLLSALRRTMVPLTILTAVLGVVAYVVWVLAVIAELPSGSHWFGIAGLAAVGGIILRFFLRGLFAAAEAPESADPDAGAWPDDRVA